MGGSGRRTGSAAPSGVGMFFRRWVGWTAAGESAGFIVAAIAGASVATQNISGLAQFAILLGAGAVEGALLGTGQAIGMARLRLPYRTLQRWPLVTSAAAVVAWSIGLLPSSLPRISWSSPVTWFVAAVLALILLASIPTAQFLLLRGVVPTAERWIGFNALAWLLGISWTLLPSPLVDADTPLLVLIGIYAVAGILMATTVALVSGLCWLHWLKRGTVELRSSG